MPDTDGEMPGRPVSLAASTRLLLKSSEFDDAGPWPMPWLLVATTRSCGWLAARSPSVQKRINANRLIGLFDWRG